MANFMSDNCAGMHPDILAAIACCNTDTADSYGQDDLTRKAEERFCEIFEKSLSAAFTVSGTAANCLALSLYTPPFGAVFCHSDAHILVDEYGAPALFTGGAQLIPVGGQDGKIDPLLFQNELRKAAANSVRPAMLSVTQPTESGTLYTVGELTALVHIARQAGLKVHMDGARLANAVAAGGHTPAELSWEAGIDILSFGGTKNGCMNAEAVVIFDNNAALKEELLLRRKKAGHTPSKMRFISAQFLAYLENNRWLAWAAHANDMAQQLEKAVTEATGITPLRAIETNEVFYDLPAPLAELLMKDGHRFFGWHDGSWRFVTSFATSIHEVQALAASLARHREVISRMKIPA